VSRWSDKVIQDFDKNKLEKSQAVANNLPYILREM
jgi:hypothetical protein